jgi:hypothetical protein
MVEDLRHSIIRPFSGSNKQPAYLKAIFIFAILGSLKALFTPLFFEFVTAMALLLYLAYYFLPNLFTAGLFFALFYQWAQISIKVIYGVITSQGLTTLAEFPENITKAFFLSALSLFVFSEGIRFSLKKINYTHHSLAESIEIISTKRIFIAYIIFNFIITLAFSLRHTIPGLFQAISLLSYFKWSLFIILFLIVFIKKELKIPFIILVVYEFIASFFSFFADFKDIIIFLIIGSFTLSLFNTKHFLLILGLIVTTYITAIVWTGVKSDYRDYLNQGTRSQAVLVSKGEARQYLIKQIKEFSRTDFATTQTDLINRMSYIDYFSATMSNVPSRVDFQNGKVLEQSVKHILMPRIIFPNKPIVDDSKHLNKYTGLYFSTYEQGVSFSLGYAGDFYIDFGPILMFLFLFLFGFIFGKILYNLHENSLNILWSLGTLSAAFSLLYKFENSQIKFLGNAIWFWLVFSFLNWIIIPWIQKKITNN